MTSSDDEIISKVAKGATEGALNWGSEKIVKLTKRFKDKDIAFVEDPKIIELAKEQRKKVEWEIFRSCVRDKDLHILFQMGLTLRDLEKHGNDFKPLASKIKKKYGTKGLHVAQFVQNGLFGKYLGNILEKELTAKELENEINNLFSNIDNTVVFIRKQDNTLQKIRKIITKIEAHSPETFIISSIGEAKTTCKKVNDGVMEEISSEYVSELYVSEQKGRRIYFLNKTEE